jgi:hypothetical protein
MKVKSFEFFLTVLIYNINILKLLPPEFPFKRKLLFDGHNKENHGH